jgi:hypothetical protein
MYEVLGIPVDASTAERVQNGDCWVDDVCLLTRELDLPTAVDEVETVAHTGEGLGHGG